MDNKKWYKRISTCFWFLLATLSIWLPIMQTLFTFFIHTDGLTTITDFNTWLGTMKSVWYGYTSELGNTYLSEMMPNWLYNTFYNLFDTLSIQDNLIAVWCSWFVWVYVIELAVDLFVWLPKFFHNLLGGVKNE